MEHTVPHSASSDPKSNEKSARASSSLREHGRRGAASWRAEYEDEDEKDGGGERGGVKEEEKYVMACGRQVGQGQWRCGRGGSTAIIQTFRSVDS